jgi:hypothetical protein
MVKDLERAARVSSQRVQPGPPARAPLRPRLRPPPTRHGAAAARAPVCQPPVPVLHDVAAVHDLPKNVAQVVPRDLGGVGVGGVGGGGWGGACAGGSLGFRRGRLPGGTRNAGCTTPTLHPPPRIRPHLGIVLQVVDRRLPAIKQVPRVEGVVHVPAYPAGRARQVADAELLALQQGGVEVAQREDDGPAGGWGWGWGSGVGVGVGVGGVAGRGF